MAVKTFIQSIVESPGMEKTALPAFLRNAGKGLWNAAMGGKTHADSFVNGKLVPGRWDPLHGIKNIGVVNDTHTEGPLKGMLKYDAKTGDPVAKGRNPLSYIKQEFKGPKPTRADLYAQYHAGKAPVSDDVFASHLDQRGLQYTRDAKGITTAVPTPRPTGVNTGEFMQNATPLQMTQMGDINQMSHLDFIKNHPGLAANWYGRNILHHGLFTGFPAYELAGVLGGNHPPDPDAGVAANLGASVGTSVGMVAGLPLGLVGGTAGSVALGEGGKRLGAGIDRAFNNRPMRERLAQQRPAPTPSPDQGNHEQYWNPGPTG